MVALYVESCERDIVVKFIFIPLEITLVFIIKYTFLLATEIIFSPVHMFDFSLNPRENSQSDVQL